MSYEQTFRSSTTSVAPVATVLGIFWGYHDRCIFFKRLIRRSIPLLGIALLNLWTTVSCCSRGQWKWVACFYPYCPTILSSCLPDLTSGREPLEGARHCRPRSTARWALMSLHQHSIVWAPWAHRPRTAALIPSCSEEEEHPWRTEEEGQQEGSLVTCALSLWKTVEKVVAQIHGRAREKASWGGTG